MSVEWETVINKEITSRVFTNIVTFRYSEGDAEVHREYLCILLVDLCLPVECAPVYFQADELLYRHSHQLRRNATEVCTPAFQIKPNNLKVAQFSHKFHCFYEALSQSRLSGTPKSMHISSCGWSYESSC